MMSASATQEYDELAARAAAGDADASILCAGYELAGRGVARSIERAHARTRAAAAAGDARALRIIAAHQLIGLAGNADPDAIGDLRQAAAAGDDVAIEILPVAEAQEAADAGSQPEIVCQSPYIAFWPGFLQPLACAYVLASARKSLRRSNVIDSDTGELKESEVRVSETAWWRPWQMDLVLHGIFIRTVEAFGGDPGLAETTNVVRYREGGIFRTHLDAYKNHATGELDETVRATTSIIYLNVGYEGGETAFIAPKLKISGATGDMLHFRNLAADGGVDQASAHAGMPLTSGEKWVLVQWVRKGPAECEQI